jgi:tetratricopeptide (TPR) repeat protein
MQRGNLGPVLARGTASRGIGRLVLAAVLLFATAATAEELAPERPWARGVSPSVQARAKALFEAGNKLLDENLFAPALDLYRQALEHWDHPAIRYNVAVTLINLERPIDAYRNLEAALRYGDAALEPELALQARSYEKLLEGQIVRLNVACEQAEVAILLDGGDFLACPGEREVLLVPGEHRLVASRPGHVTRTVALVLTGGEARRVPIELMTVEQATVEHRRWATWKPWAVVAGGLAVGSVGLGFELRARATYQSYDNAIAVLCATRPCADEQLPEVVTAAHARASRQHRIGVGLMAAGLAVAGAGAVLAILNRSRRERIGYDERPALVPVITSDMVGVAAIWSP